MTGKRTNDRVDRWIRDLAARQSGVAGRRQLLAAGVARHEIDDRVAAGALISIHRGVYAVGHRVLVPDGFRLAAVLACGPAAYLSHRSAADAWELLATRRRRVEVTSMTAGRKHPGIQAHRCRLTPHDVTTLRGIPITTVARTLLDVAEVVPFAHTRRAFERAHQLALFDARAVEAVLVRARGRRGRRPLERAYGLFRPEHAASESELEAMAQRLVERHRLPRPEVNRWLGAYRIDLLWRAQRLAVELDSRTFHDTPLSFESDRRRDAELQAAGFRAVRFTWRQLTEQPAWVARTLGALLAATESREGDSNP